MSYEASCSRLQSQSVKILLSTTLSRVQLLDLCKELEFIFYSFDFPDVWYYDTSTLYLERCMPPRLTLWDG